MTAAYFADDDYYSATVSTGPDANFDIQGDAPSTPKDGPFTGLSKLLGSIGTTARDVGTAVGTVKREVRGAEGQYRAAENAAENPRPAGRAMQWWSYASPTDKMMLMLAAAGVAIAFYQMKKG